MNARIMADKIISSIRLMILLIPSRGVSKIFRQKRYGMDGKSITVFKFRTMTVMENDLKVVQALALGM
jgi:lipopolysaccharide/colanic/teichoic acid biosynthesis glycosyltransferase